MAQFIFNTGPPTFDTLQEIAVLIRSIKFLSPEVALFLYKSTRRPCM